MILPAAFGSVTPGTPFAGAIPGRFVSILNRTRGWITLRAGKSKLRNATMRY